MAGHKYLDECGFTVFEFGRYPDGRVDVSNSKGEDVATGVTVEQGKQIEQYISRLEVKVQEYIERHYWTPEEQVSSALMKSSKYNITHKR
jgi:flagellar biosynthesis chaperone FliJ